MSRGLRPWLHAPAPSGAEVTEGTGIQAHYTRGTGAPRQDYWQVWMQDTQSVP